MIVDCLRFANIYCFYFMGSIICFVNISLCSGSTMTAFITIILVFVVYVIVNVADSRLSRPRGVSIARASLYPFSDKFVCFDGLATVSFENINDNYCDCPDGSDEPGTSACPNGTFDCSNIGFQSTSIPSSRVNDGICDCCDGSDEYSSKVQCVNRCFEIAKNLRDEVDRRYQQQRNLHEMYQEYSRKGQELKKEKMQKIETLTKQKQELEQMQAQFKTLKVEAETEEQEAIFMHTMLSQEMPVAEPCVSETTDATETCTTEPATEQLSSVSVEESSSSNEDLSAADAQTDKKSEDVQSVKQMTEVTDEQATVKQTDETNEDKQAVKQTVDTCEDKEAVTQTFGLVDDVQAVKQTEETSEDMQVVKQTTEVTGEQAVKQTEVVTEESGDNTEPVTPTVECKDKQKLMQYNEQTLQVIEAAKKAREQLKDVSLKLLNVIAEFHHCHRFLATDFGQAAEFAPVSLRCYDFSDDNYVYSLCLFDRVTQRSKSTGMSVMLGKWGQWSDTEERKYTVMHYEHGEKCADSLLRLAKVHVECGLTDMLTSVTESTMCNYQLMFTTPAACSQPPLSPTTDPVYDEL